MRCALLCAALILAGCAEPNLGLSIEADSYGVDVSPRASGKIGGLTVGVQG